MASSLLGSGEPESLESSPSNVCVCVCVCCVCVWGVHLNLWGGELMYGVCVCILSNLLLPTSHIIGCHGLRVSSLLTVPPSACTSEKKLLTEEDTHGVHSLTTETTPPKRLNC